MYDPNTIERWNRAVEGREEQVDRAGRLYSDLVKLMADLRSPGGCPWDAEQSLASLRQYVREEADEVCEAVDAILEYEAQLRGKYGLPPADPTPPLDEDKARTKTKGLSIAHHPHREDFDPVASASGAPFPKLLSSDEADQLEKLYAELFKEMGDLALQSVFLGDILSAMGRGGVELSILRLVEKLIRRHPHVYGERDVKDSAEVLFNWENIKSEEREQGL